MACPHDTDGDGDCGNINCPHCGGGPVARGRMYGRNVLPQNVQRVLALQLTPPSPGEVAAALESLVRQMHEDSMNGHDVEPYRIAIECIRWAYGMGLGNAPVWLRVHLRKGAA
jgi:hypothetical protein